MKKIILTIIITLTSFLILANSSFAVAETKTITSAHTTDVNENPKTVFSWSEIPYLFSTFNFWRALEKEVWVSPTLNSYDFKVLDNRPDKDFDPTSQEILNTLPKWDTRKEIGLWTWFARANNGSPNGQTLTGTFTITPEPVSSVLFLIGGAAFLVRHNRSRKIASR